MLVKPYNWRYSVGGTLQTEIQCWGIESFGTRRFGPGPPESFRAEIFRTEYNLPVPHPIVSNSALTFKIRFTDAIEIPPSVARQRLVSGNSVRNISGGPGPML